MNHKILLQQIRNLELQYKYQKEKDIEELESRYSKCEKIEIEYRDVLVFHNGIKTKNKEDFDFSNIKEEDLESLALLEANELCVVVNL
jgi:hypothetical protein